MIFTLLSLSKHCNILAGIHEDKLNPSNILFIQQNYLVFNLYVYQNTEAIFQRHDPKIICCKPKYTRVYGIWVHVFVLEITVGPSDSSNASQSHIYNFCKQVNPPNPSDIFLKDLHPLNDNFYKALTVHIPEGTPLKPRNPTYPIPSNKSTTSTPPVFFSRICIHGMIIPPKP